MASERGRTLRVGDTAACSAGSQPAVRSPTRAPPVFAENTSSIPTPTREGACPRMAPHWRTPPSPTPDSECANLAPPAASNTPSLDRPGIGSFQPPDTRAAFCRAGRTLSTGRSLIRALRAAGPSVWLLATGCPLLLDDDFSALPPAEETGGNPGVGGGAASGPALAGAGGNLSANPSGEAGAGIGGSLAQGSSGGTASAGGFAGNSFANPAGGTGAGTGGSLAQGSSGGESGAGGSSNVASCAERAVLGPNGHCYVVDTTSSSWRNARSSCHRLGDGWDLTAVLGPRESAFLSSILSTEAWIGADDTNGTGVWRWVRDDAEFWQGGSSGDVSNDAYVNWNAGEPTSDGATACLRISPSALWDAVDCGSGFPALCEGPATLLTSGTSQVSP
jgi:hypothetical protein